MRLRSLRFIKDFRVGEARYSLTDQSGNQVDLLVDYASNQFRIKELQVVSSDFIDEVSQVARGLLARKHAINLAQKQHYLVDTDLSSQS